MATLSELLDAETRFYNLSRSLKEEVAHCVGASWEDIERDASKVKGFWIDAGAEVFTAWLVTARLLGMHQRTTSGQTLTLTFPLGRIRRLQLAGEAESLALLLELDSDQQVISLVPENNIAFLRPSAYEITATGEQRVALRAFLRNLCRQLEAA